MGEGVVALWDQLFLRREFFRVESKVLKGSVPCWIVQDMCLWGKEDKRERRLEGERKREVR